MRAACIAIAIAFTKKIASVCHEVEVTQGEGKGRSIPFSPPPDFNEMASSKGKVISFMTLLLH